MSIKDRLTGSKLGEKFAEVSADAVEKATAATTALGALGREKMEGTLVSALEELAAVKPLLEEGGFRVFDTLVTASIPPSFGVEVEPTGDGIGLEAVMAREGLTRSQTGLLQAIRQLYELEGMLRDHGQSIWKIHITLGAPPKLRAHIRAV